MAQQNGSKGNPAGKRMLNVKLKEKRARSWARGQKRKDARRAANEARAAANLSELRSLGGVQQMYERVVERDGRVVSRMKLESPGSALARVRRQVAA